MHPAHRSSAQSSSRFDEIQQAHPKIETSPLTYALLGSPEGCRVSVPGLVYLWQIKRLQAIASIRAISAKHATLPRWWIVVQERSWNVFTIFQDFEVSKHFGISVKVDARAAEAQSATTERW